MAKFKTGDNYVVNDDGKLIACFPTRQAARICKRTLDYQKKMANNLRNMPSTVRVFTSTGTYIH
jgi:hypothetical protein